MDGASELVLDDELLPAPTESFVPYGRASQPPSRVDQQALVHTQQPRRLPGPAGRGLGGGSSAPQPSGVGPAGVADADFLSRPWLSALQALDLEEFDERHPLLQHTVRTATGFSKSGKLGRLLAMVVSLQRTYSGQAFVRLKDPTGCIGGTISQQALEEEPGIQPGSVLILDKVTVLRLPSLRPLHHVCITLENIAQVIPAGPQRHSTIQPFVAAHSRPPAAVAVPLLPAPGAPSLQPARQAAAPLPDWLRQSASPALTNSTAGTFAAPRQPGGSAGISRPVSVPTTQQLQQQQPQYGWPAPPGPVASSQGGGPDSGMHMRGQIPGGELFQQQRQQQQGLHPALQATSLQTCSQGPPPLGDRQALHQRPQHGQGSQAAPNPIPQPTSSQAVSQGGPPFGGVLIHQQQQQQQGSQGRQGYGTPGMSRPTSSQALSQTAPAHRGGGMQQQRQQQQGAQSGGQAAAMQWAPGIGRPTISQAYSQGPLQMPQQQYVQSSGQATAVLGAPGMAQPTSSQIFSQGSLQAAGGMCPPPAQPGSSSQMGPPPPRAPYQDVSNTQRGQQQGVSQKAVAPLLQQLSQPGQPMQQSRGVGWLQNLLQELPPSDGFGCSQATAGAAPPAGAQQQMQVQHAGPGAVSERDAKRLRPSEELLGAATVFGDGIDELMAGLEDELDF